MAVVKFARTAFINVGTALLPVARIAIGTFTADHQSHAVDFTGGVGIAAPVVVIARAIIGGRGWGAAGSNKSH